MCIIGWTTWPGIEPRTPRHIEWLVNKLTNKYSWGWIYSFCNPNLES